jgi:hypothetical protein
VPSDQYTRDKFTVDREMLARFNAADTAAWEAYQAGPPQPGCVPPQ